jgi:hypothetical protein
MEVMSQGENKLVGSGHLQLGFSDLKPVLITRSMLITYRMKNL